MERRIAFRLQAPAPGGNGQLPRTVSLQHKQAICRIVPEESQLIGHLRAADTRLVRRHPDRFDPAAIQLLEPDVPIREEGLPARIAAAGHAQLSGIRDAEIVQRRLGEIIAGRLINRHIPIAGAVLIEQDLPLFVPDLIRAACIHRDPHSVCVTKG